jgi:hypothetical protein
MVFVYSTNRGSGNQQLQQQTGMPFIIRQQMQPASMHLVTQSQHDWHMSQQALSPLVQVKQTPCLVSATLQLHMQNEHWQIVMPFIMHEQLHMPPAIILHRFCSVAALISSSQVQVSFIPPAHFSNFIVQRGTIIIDGEAGAIAGMPPWGIEPMGPIEPIIERSNIMVDIRDSP